MSTGIQFLGSQTKSYQDQGMCVCVYMYIMCVCVCLCMTHACVCVCVYVSVSAWYMCVSVHVSACAFVIIFAFKCQSLIILSFYLPNNINPNFQSVSSLRLQNWTERVEHLRQMISFSSDNWEHRYNDHDLNIHWYSLFYLQVFMCTNSIHVLHSTIFSWFSSFLFSNFYL